MSAEKAGRPESCMDSKVLSKAFKNKKRKKTGDYSGDSVFIPPGLDKEVEEELLYKQTAFSRMDEEGWVTESMETINKRLEEGEDGDKKEEGVMDGSNNLFRKDGKKESGQV